MEYHFCNQITEDHDLCLASTLSDSSWVCFLMEKTREAYDVETEGSDLQPTQQGMEAPSPRALKELNPAPSLLNDLQMRLQPLPTL